MDLSERFLERSLGAVDGATAIDVGCGPGNTAQILLRRGAAFVHCVDLSPRMLALNEARNGASGRIRNHKADPGTGLPGELDARADLLLFSHSIGFFEDVEACVRFYTLRAAAGAQALVMRAHEDLDLETNDFPVGGGRRVWVRQRLRPTGEYVRAFESWGWRLRERTSFTIGADERALLPFSDRVFLERYLGMTPLECVRLART